MNEEELRRACETVSDNVERLKIYQTGQTIGEKVKRHEVVFTDTKTGITTTSFVRDQLITDALRDDNMVFNLTSKLKEIAIDNLSSYYRKNLLEKIPVLEHNDGSGGGTE